MNTLARLSRHFPDLPDLNKRLCFYLEALAAADFDGILLLTYPGIFDVVPKELLREKIMDTFQGDETEMSIDSFEIDQVGKLWQHQQGQYVQVDYTVLISMRMKEEEYDDPVRQQERHEFLLRMFRAFYGGEKAWYNPETDCYCFYQQKSMVAIQDALSPQWTFLAYEQDELMKRFIPSDILLLIRPAPDA